MNICGTWNISERMLLLFLMLAAFFVRIICVTLVPPGLWIDEANHGLDALTVINGWQFPIYFPSNVGQEPLFKYFCVLILKLFGIGSFSIRIVSVLAGTLAIPLLYLFVRELLDDRVIAFVAALVLAFSRWHIHFSRIGFRGILIPTVVLLCLYFLVRALKYGRWRDYVFCGIVTGAGFYTYVSFRVFPLVYIFLVGHLIFSNWRLLKGQLPKLVLVLFLSATVVLPLFLYALDHNELFFARMEQTSIFSEEGSAIANISSNIGRYCLMFFLFGDQLLRHNIPDRPMLPYLFMPFMAVGLIMVISRIGEWRFFLLLSSFLVALIPGVLSQTFQAPAALRTLGVTPFSSLFIALALVRFYRLLPFEKRIMRSCKLLMLSPGAFSAVIVLFIIVGAFVQDQVDYFAIWRMKVSQSSPVNRSYEAFNSDEKKIALLINQYSDRCDFYVSPQLFLHSTFQFFIYRKSRPVMIINPDDIAGIIAGNKDRVFVVCTLKRNLWWMRSSWVKNFFDWSKRYYGLTDDDIWDAKRFCYPPGIHFMSKSDIYLLDRIKAVFPEGRIDTIGCYSLYWIVD